MGLLTRRGLLLAVLLGALGATLLWRWRREPCHALAREYAGAYAALRECRVDRDCVLDPPAVHGPALCDRARSTAAGDRSRLVAIERTFEARCEPKPLECPPLDGARCERGACRATPSRSRP